MLPISNLIHSLCAPPEHHPIQPSMAPPVSELRLTRPKRSKTPRAHDVPVLLSALEDTLCVRLEVRGHDVRRGVHPNFASGYDQTQPGIR
jgi:hypothetical protein